MAKNPVHIAKINDIQVRFFKTPLNDGRPDLPWVSLEDLAKACKLPRNFRRELRNRLSKSPQDESRTVAVAGEIVKIIPHFMAQGLYGAAVECGGVDISGAYTIAAKDAFDTPAFSYNIPRAAVSHYLMTAVSRWE